MKKSLLLIGIFQFVLSGMIIAQWTPINTGLGGHNPTSMYGWPGLDAAWLGTAGGGVFKTIDNGNNWVDINGDLPNLNVNDITSFGTGTSMYVATEGGPFFTMDEITYTNCTTPGLTNTDINFFGIGGHNPETYAIATNGGGVFVGVDWSGPWTAASTGLSGNSLIVNNISFGAKNNVSYTVLGSDGGVYFADSTLNPWTQKNNGLSGDALLVQKLFALGGGVFIVTHGGMYASTDLGDNWNVLIPNEKLNAMTIVQTPSSPTGWAIFAFGINGYYSVDFTNFTPIDMTGITGEVTCVAVTTTDIIIGVDDGNMDIGDDTRSGIVYRKSLDQVLAIEDENSAVPQEYRLEQNYPNPFNPNTTIKYQIPEISFVTLKVYDVLGNEVTTLVNKEEAIATGSYEVEFDATGLPSGVYFYQLQAGSFVDTKKMVLIK